MSGILAPELFQAFNTNGQFLVGGLLYTYAAGTSTPQATYTDYTLGTPNTNPVVLNAYGQAAVWLDVTKNYKLVLQDSAGNTLWTLDNINSPALTGAYIGSLLWPQTVAEIAASVTPTVFTYQEGDIRRYGATTAASDNSSAINNALLVSAYGGNATFIPGGTWNITSALVTGNSSYPDSNMYGVGVESIIIPSNCDGLHILPSGTYAGSRFFRDFFFKGPSTTTSSYNAILMSMGASRVTGIQFNNLTIENFATAVNVTGTGGIWNCAFTDCFLYNNYQGYYLNGKVIVLNIRGGFVQAATMTGAGTQYGVYTNAAVSSQQSLHLSGVGIYAYGTCILLNQTLYAVIEGCDLSQYTITAITINGAQGGTFIRDCWMQAFAATNNVIGINIIDLAVGINDKIVIDSNELVGNSGTGTEGIYCGTNQLGISILNNTIGTAGGPFVVGVGGANGAESTNLVCKFNTFYCSISDIILYSSGYGNAEIGPNVHVPAAAANPLTFSSAGVAPPNLNFVQNNIPMRGTASFSASTSAPVAFTVNMPATSYQIGLSQGVFTTSAIYWTGKGLGGFTLNNVSVITGSVDWVVSL